ncbi:MAG: alpha/beta hydrolase [Rhodocyclaceae bacterium]|nr:alpha/beta hydrolase [Rhodocyclaceae bacterium]
MHRGLAPAKAALLGAAFSFLAAGCSSLESRDDLAARAGAKGFAAQEMKAGGFDLAAFVRRPQSPVATLTIYIEGDGAAWPTPYHPPHDPTPARPLALALAIADPAPAVAYLGRPCQYLDTEALQRCPASYWTERRFAPEVVDAYDAAISRLAAVSGARHVRLVGYSGGGVIAALLAARRNDIDRLVTVAAPLALTEWTTWHDVSPLTGSLDPTGSDTRHPMQTGVHFVGENDKTVPATIVERHIRAKGGRMLVIPGFDHECCWAREWTGLLLRTGAEEKIK